MSKSKEKGKALPTVHENTGGGGKKDANSKAPSATASTTAVTNKPKVGGKVSNKLAKMSPELDSILDQALDEFEENALSTKAREAARRPGEESGLRDLQKEKRDKVLEIGKMLDNLQDPQYGTVLHKTLTSLSATKGGGDDVESLFDNIAHQFDSEFKPSKYFDRTCKTITILCTSI